MKNKERVLLFPTCLTYRNQAFQANQCGAVATYRLLGFFFSLYALLEELWGLTLSMQVWWDELPVSLAGAILFRSLKNKAAGTQQHCEAPLWTGWWKGRHSVLSSWKAAQTLVSPFQLLQGSVPRGLDIRLMQLWWLSLGETDLSFFQGTGASQGGEK